MHGHGILIFPVKKTGGGGSKYEGEFQHGQYYGQGQLIQTNNIYEGQFVNGQKHGAGEMVLFRKDKLGNKFNNTYSGDWKWNKRTGFGRLDYGKTGDFYVGTFKNGVMIQGDLHFNRTGEIYSGKFLRNKPMIPTPFLICLENYGEPPFTQNFVNQIIQTGKGNTKNQYLSTITNPKSSLRTKKSENQHGACTWIKFLCYNKFVACKNI